MGWGSRLPSHSTVAKKRENQLDEGVSGVVAVLKSLLQWGRIK